MTANSQIRVSRPVPVTIPITSPFGSRIINGAQQFHKGIDFGCPAGTIVHAVADGKVNRAGWENPQNELQGYGLRVWQTATIGGMTYDIWYGHCLELLVKSGEEIKAGQEIAKSGFSGHVVPTGHAGAHLHLGIRRAKTGEFIEPLFDTPTDPRSLPVM